MSCCWSARFYTEASDRGQAAQGFVIIGAVIMDLLFSAAAVVVGAVALWRQRRSGPAAKDHALTGVAFGTVGFLVIGWFAFVMMRDTPMRNGDGELIKSGYVWLSEMRVGDCAAADNPSGIAMNTKVTVVPCRDPHTIRKVAELSTFNPDWSPIETPGKQLCSERLAADGSKVDDSHLVALEGISAVQCFVFS